MTTPRIFTSSKFQASFIQTLLISIPLIFTLIDKNLDRKSKQEACIATIIASAGVWGVAIHATGREDAAKAGAQTPTSPAVQVNTADSQNVSGGNNPQPQAVLSEEVASIFEDVYKQLAKLKAPAASFNSPTDAQLGLQANREASGIFRDYSQTPVTSPSDNVVAWQRFKVAPKGKK